MILKEIKIKAGGPDEMRYQVTLTTDVGGIHMYWRTNITANSPQQALVIVQDVFKNNRKKFQDAMLRQWKISDITPIEKKGG